MKPLIIGHLGYVGSAVHARIPDARGVDLRDLHGIDYRWLSPKILDTYSPIIWLAGHSSVGQCLADPRAAFENNLNGLVQLVGYLRKNQRLIYASSGSVYGARDNMYDATKRAADDMLPLLYPNAVGLRFGTVAGPTPRAAAQRFDTMINGMTRDALTRGAITVRNPTVNRPILGINDLCRAIELCMTDKVKPGIYDLWSFHTTVGECATIISTMTSAIVEMLGDTSAYDFKMGGKSLAQCGFEANDSLLIIVQQLRESIETKAAA